MENVVVVGGQTSLEAQAAALATDIQISGSVALDAVIDVETAGDTDIDGTIDLSDSVCGEIGTITEISPSEYEPYLGEYVITPLAREDQVLATKNKRMLDDFTVLKVPYWETSNLEDGLTVYIANEV